MLAQQELCGDKDIPWGISECAFAKVEENGVYGYRAFGVPQLAVQQDEERLVVAPYATMLALAIDPADGHPQSALDDEEAVVRQVRLLRGGRLHCRRAALAPSALRPGALVDGPSPGHEPAGHRQFPEADVVQQWFRRDARVQATELLLQERPVAHVAAAPQKKRRTKVRS